MSSVLNVPYKSICSGTRFDESSVKNYTNDKSSRSLRASEMYAAFADRCAQILASRQGEPVLDDFVLYMLKHLFGDQWLQAASIRLPPGGGQHGPVDHTLAQWLGVSSDESAEVEQRYSGLWTVVRASSFPRPDNAPADLKEISCSLLNIRPRDVVGGTLCDFRWYSLGKGREKDERRVVEGYVIPNVDRIEFLGRVSTRHKLMTLMVWRFVSNPEVGEHASVASGVALTLNTSGGPVAARMRAFFVENSHKLKGEEFEALKSEQLDDIGVKPSHLLPSLIPPEQVERTLSSLAEYEPIVGFFPVQDEA
jgi:hypothetical protein